MKLLLLYFIFHLGDHSDEAPNTHKECSWLHLRAPERQKLSEHHKLMALNLGNLLGDALRAGFYKQKRKLFVQQYKINHSNPNSGAGSTEDLDCPSPLDTHLEPEATGPD